VRLYMARTCAENLATHGVVYGSIDKVECLQSGRWSSTQEAEDQAQPVTCQLTPAPSALVHHTAACYKVSLCTPPGKPHCQLCERLCHKSRVGALL